MAEHGAVTGFDASTGAVLWTHRGMPGGVGSVAGPGDLVLLYDILQQTDPPQPPPAASKLFPVTALDAVTGAVRWRARTAAAVSQLSAGNGLIVVGTSSADFSRALAEDRARYMEVIRVANIKLE